MDSRWEAGGGGEDGRRGEYKHSDPKFKTPLKCGIWKWERSKRIQVLPWKNLLPQTERKQEEKRGLFAVSPKTVSLRDHLEAEYGEERDRISQLLAAVFCLLSPCTVTADFFLKVLANSTGNKDVSEGKYFC